MNDVHANFADNMRQLREARGLSQGQAAKLAGMPRATWSNLESGDGNPTLAVLMKVAEAMQIRVDELLSSTTRPVGRIKASDMPERRRGDAVIRALVPEHIPGIELERISLGAGDRSVGVPHTDSTRAYLTCERGVIELVAEGMAHRLEPGDVAVFRGDRKHHYVNVGRTEAVAFATFVASARSCPLSTV